MTFNKGATFPYVVLVSLSVYMRKKWSLILATNPNEKKIKMDHKPKCEKQNNKASRRNLRGLLLLFYGRKWFLQHGTKASNIKEKIISKLDSTKINTSICQKHHWENMKGKLQMGKVSLKKSFQQKTPIGNIITAPSNQ